MENDRKDDNIIKYTNRKSYSCDEVVVQCKTLIRLLIMYTSLWNIRNKTHLYYYIYYIYLVEARVNPQYYTISLL